MMTLPSLAGKTYAVMGLDRSGLATVRALVAAGAKVLAWDDKPAQCALAQDLGAEVQDLSTANLSGVTALLLTPGIPHHLPKPHPVAARAQQYKIPILGEIELFAQSKPKAKIIGITGTNGKSTTTALIGHILTTAGLPCTIGGNFGIPALDLPELPVSGVYVLELSSYQLERCPSLAVDVGIMLNLTPDHLARHGDMDGYAAAKARLFAKPKPQATIVFGTEDSWTREIGRAAGKRGWLMNPIDVERDFCPPLPATLPGRHNRQNALAALYACRALGLSDAQITQGFASYPGLAHRQQQIAEVEGVRFINDSKATNADATARALICYDDIYWIIGGQPKEGGLDGLEEYMPRIRKAFLIGEAQEAFAAWLDGKAPYERCGDLATATRRAFEAAQGKTGAVVLLSPACASWDQFKSFEHRGEVFSALAQTLTKG